MSEEVIGWSLSSSEQMEYLRKDIRKLKAENAKLRKMAEKYILQAYALACEKGNPITKGIIAEDARELGLEMEQ